jgi:hypothetical protein
MQGIPMSVRHGSDSAHTFPHFLICRKGIPKQYRRDDLGWPVHKVNESSMFKPATITLNFQRSTNFLILPDTFKHNDTELLAVLDLSINACLFQTYCAVERLFISDVLCCGNVVYFRRPVL